MSTASGNSWQVIFSPQKQTSAAFAEFTESYFEVIACNYCENGEEYVGYASAPIDEKQLQQAAEQAGITLPPYQIQFLPATNWLTKNVIKFPPLVTEKFFIYGAHEDTPPVTSKLALRIYAATAFGSGQHQTTRSCLRLLEKLFARGISANKILDMGCGSGILALSALKLWDKATACAADIDEEAVIVTLQNAADNGLSDRIRAAAGNGCNNPAVSQMAPYDLIFSNILARPLIEMAPALAAHLIPGGFAVLSGFVDDQTDWVLDAYRKQGLHLAETIADDNWRAVLVEKIPNDLTTNPTKPEK